MYGQTQWIVLPPSDNYFRFHIYGNALDTCWTLEVVTDAYDICKDFPTFTVAPTHTFTPVTTYTPTYTPTGTPTVVCTPGIGHVYIEDFDFTPQQLTVTEGSTVYWTNDGATAHTVTSDDGLFDSGPIAPGNVYSHQFFGAGTTYTYHCSIHPQMTGSVTVIEACGRPSRTPTPTSTPTSAIIDTYTPTSTRSPTYTPTPSCSVCNAYISDINITCRNGAVAWSAVLRNNATCTIANLAWETPSGSTALGEFRDSSDPDGDGSRSARAFHDQRQLLLHLPGGHNPGAAPVPLHNPAVRLQHNKGIARDFTLPWVRWLYSLD